MSAGPRPSPGSYPTPRAPRAVPNPPPRRGVQLVLVLQGVVLTGFGVASLIAVLVTAGPVVEVLVFQMSLPHAVMLLVAGLISLATTARVRGARLWVAGQAVGFMLWFLIGTANAQPPMQTWLKVDRAGNLGHLGLALIAIALFMVMAGPWLTGNRIPGTKQTGEEPLIGGVGAPDGRPARRRSGVGGGG